MSCTRTRGKKSTPHREPTDPCNAPHLSSGEERRTGAVVVVAFKLPGRFVAQGGVEVLLVVRGDPGFQGTDYGKGTGPFLEPEAFFFECAHPALGVSITLGIVVAGKGLLNPQGVTGLHKGERGGLTAVV